MKKIFLILLMFSFNIFASAPKNSFWDDLSQLNTYSAHFKEITYDATGNVQQMSSGQMALMRPGNFRWETLNPIHQILIAHQNILWVYDVDLQQATRQNFNAQAQHNPAALLSGSVKEAQAQFAIAKTQQQNQQTCFTLIPKTQQPLLKNVALCFQKNILQSMMMVNPFGDKTVFSFSDIQLNQTISPSQFQFQPPKGVDVLENR